jgi:hypothetical protein
MRSHIRRSLPHLRRSLLLVSASPDPWLTIARRLPLMGRFAPPSQMVHWERVAVYRVPPRTPAGTSGGSASYEALLMDAVSDTLGEVRGR